VGTLFSALDIGRAGLQVAQVQLDITGHNIANVNKIGFSRQRVELITRMPNYTPYGAIGRGPGVAGIERLREGFLDFVYRQSVQGFGNASIRARYFARIEDIFQEPGSTGFGTRLDAFFDALNDFSTHVEDIPVRVALLSEAQALAAGLKQAAERLKTLRTNANEEVRNLVPEANSLMSRIADLNGRIREAELSGQSANDLRDDRDVLIDELAQIINITYREREDGQIDIMVGSDMVVNGDKYREMRAVATPAIDPGRPDLLEVRFVDTDDLVTITDGELFGALNIRDSVLVSVDNRLDELARTLIHAVNRIHSSGNGLSAVGVPMTSTYPVNSAATALTLAGLPFTVQDGSFEIYVYDSAGNIVDSVTVPVLASGNPALQTDLAAIESAINGLTGMSALVGPDGRLTITPDAGYSFTFANDTSGALAALGLNSFFTGFDAETIDVNQLLLDHPEYVTSAYSTDPLDTGDNSAALDLAALRNALLLGGDTQTFSAYYQATVVQVGVDTRANDQTLTVERSFVEDFDRRRLEVSGVNLDEEVTFLIQFQRAFEASARVITVADRMLETLLNVAL